MPGTVAIKSSPNHKVEGRNGMMYVEEDWVDEMAVEHRETDDYGKVK